MKELLGRMKALADEGAEIFRVGREKGNGELDLTAEQVSRMQQINAELKDLRAKVDAQKELLQLETDVTKYRQELGQPAPFVHPNGKSVESEGGDDAPIFGGRARQVAKTLGDIFIESDAFKQYSPATKRSPVFEADLTKIYGKDLRMRYVLSSKTLLTETGFAPQAVRTDRIVPGALRRPVVADLLPQGDTNQIAIVYMEETTTTNAAAAVSEGGSKPESALAFTERSAPVRKIATVLPVTDELFNDVPAMRSYVEARLRLFLELAEENQLLNGTGVAPQMTGLLNVSGILTQALGADNAPDAIYKAVNKIRTTSFLEPDGVIIHPNNWQTIRLLKTTDGAYLWGPPMSDAPDQIWGIPVVQTPVIAAGTSLVGAYGAAAQMFRRAQVTFAVSTEHQDFFVTNQLMLRVEERAALAVYRPSGFCTVTGLL